MNKLKTIVIILQLLLCHAYAAEHVIDLNVECTTVNFTNINKPAIAVNGQIPAPTLHFKQGDTVTINVHNHLNKETAIHWHGIILPWQMDGVLGITQKGIPPGKTFSYQFTLHQSGTYWYHAHAGLQEQQGLYGAFIIEPNELPAYSYTADHVVVLSDWSNTRPNQILANLKKDGDYYAPDFPIQPSLTKFMHDYCAADNKKRCGLINDYKEMQNMRMSIYDLSDIAYDAYLLNGKPNSRPWTTKVKVGDTVRLRFIGAGASTIFNVKIPGTTMQMVHIDGNDIEPYEIDNFSVAPGETFDVLVKINEDKPYIIYAESKDQVGAAYGALITQTNQTVNYKQVKTFPEPPPVTQTMMENMMQGMHQSSSNSMSMDMHQQHQMQNSGHNEHSNHNTSNKEQAQMHMDHQSMQMSHSMATESSIIGDKYIIDKSKLNFGSKTFGTKYDNLRASIPTNDPNKPVDAIIRMELFGYMDRYIWFINGVPAYNAKPLPLEEGKRYRIVFTNTSMMSHPMHIHGHWFILRNGNESYDPLLHTIDVAPGATATADVDADASGQWFFHCHILYHMDSGMARVFQYTSLPKIIDGLEKPKDEIKETGFHNRPIVRVDEIRPINKNLVRHPQAHAKGFYFSNFIEVSADPFNNVQNLTYEGMFGDDYNKLQIFMNGAELEKGKIADADVDIFYWRLISQFWAVKAGANYFYRPALKPYWQVGFGLEGLMPYFIETDARVYLYGGSLKLDLELNRDTQITNNFYISLGLRSILATKTIDRAQIGSGLNQMRYSIKPNYWVKPGINVFFEYELQQNSGAFKKLQRAEGEPSTQNTFSFGVSLLL